MACLRRSTQSSARVSLGAATKAWEVDLILLYLKVCLLKEMCSDYFARLWRTVVGLLEVQRVKCCLITFQKFELQK